MEKKIDLEKLKPCMVYGFEIDSPSHWYVTDNYMVTHNSWGCLGIAELYSKMFGIEFEPEVHVISSLKELLLLITSSDADKKIKFTDTHLLH